MNRRLVLALSATLAALHGAACAQGLPQVFPEEHVLPQPVEPGKVAPWNPSVAVAGDPGETGSLYVPPTGPTLADWYNKQGRPTLVLFFDRRLERLPPGWNGTSRLMLEHEMHAGGKVETESLSVAVERKTPVESVRNRTPVVLLVENSLTREMQRMRLKLVDPNFVERALASRGKGGDIEFDSLKGSARYVLEVELAATGESVSMIGGLKSLASGEIVATVNQPVTHNLRYPADTDALAHAFIKRLLESEPPVH